MSNNPKRLSFSTQKMLHTCARKFYLYTQIKKPFFRPAMEVGSGFHKLMELSAGDPMLIEDGYAVWRAKRLESLNSFNKLTEEEVGKVNEAHDKAWALWLGYSDAVYQRLLSPRITRILATEYKFLMRVGDVYVPGVIDYVAMIENPFYGSEDQTAVCPGEAEILVIGDYKTTGEDMELFSSALVQSHQPGIYMAWAQSAEFEAAFPEVFSSFGYPNGFVFDVLGTPDIRFKKSETWAEFLDRYRKELTKVAGKGQSQKLRRFLFTPSSASVKDTLLTFQQDGMLLDLYQSSGHFPKAGDPGTCIQYSRMCEYASECNQMTEGNLPQAPRLVQILPADNQQGLFDDGDSDTEFF